MMRKQHIIYMITNILNGRFYVGMHTGYPNDGYLGSGKRIKAEIKKYGKDNFKKEIFEVFPDRKSLELREAELVNAELLADPLCLNLKNGGEGGGKKWSDKHQQIRSAAGGKSGGKKTGPVNGSRALKRAHTEGKIKYDTFTGRKHSEETKQKMREAHKRRKHSSNGDVA